MLFFQHNLTLAGLYRKKKVNWDGKVDAVQSHTIIRLNCSECSCWIVVCWIFKLSDGSGLKESLRYCPWFGMWRISMLILSPMSFLHMAFRRVQFKHHLLTLNMMLFYMFDWKFVSFYWFGFLVLWSKWFLIKAVLIIDVRITQACTALYLCNTQTKTPPKAGDDQWNIWWNKA